MKEKGLGFVDSIFMIFALSLKGDSVLDVFPLRQVNGTFHLDIESVL